jgi:hypothetical protein
VVWCPFLLFRPLGLVISYVVINIGLLFISLFVALCVKLDPCTYKGNAFSFSLKTGCDNFHLRNNLEWHHTGKPCQHALVVIIAQQFRDVGI